MDTRRNRPDEPLAGWHPDPYDPVIDRYWDGDQWTGQTRPPADAPTAQSGATAAAPAAGAVGSPDGRPPKKSKVPWIAGGTVARSSGLCLGPQ
ncbi:DUF2510 domain-containing protein [Rhodococcus hoagii]|nr:DUF2510 domain-containing protein [Prescottella equi]